MEAVRSALSQVLIRKTVEVIIVDDASTDGSLEFIADVFDQCKIIKHPKNLGMRQRAIQLYLPVRVNIGFVSMLTTI